MIPGRKAGDEWVGPRGMVYCWCPPGKFTMGSPETETGRFTDEAQREVSVKEGFWIIQVRVATRPLAREQEQQGD